MESQRIAIVGYGSAGQASAVLLERDGHEVTVFERVTKPGPVGAGFLLQPNGLQVLWRMGLLEPVLRHGARVDRLFGDTPCGRAVMDMRYAGLDRRLHGVGLQRGALFSILDSAWPGRARALHAGREIVAVDHARGLLRDARGEVHGPYDLVVVADGAGSRLRQEVAAPRIDRPYPWGALWCLLPETVWPWRHELRQRYRLAREMAGLLPVGTMPGDPTRRLSFFWSLPTQGFDAWRDAGPEAWFDRLQALWPQAREHLGDHFDTACLARAAYRDAIPRQWWRGRAVLLGDAAHAMSPQLGQGVNMALVDACALAARLDDAASLADGLAAYAHERRTHLAAYHRYSRWLTPLFQSERDTLARLRDAGFLAGGRLPLARGHMLRVLSGTQQGWFGRYPLAPAFVAALQDALAENPLE